MVKLTKIKQSLIEIPAGEIDSATWYPMHSMRAAAEAWKEKFTSQQNAVKAFIKLARDTCIIREHSLTGTLDQNNEGLYEFRRFIGLSKTKHAVARIIDEHLRTKHKTIVFATHRDIMVDLRERLREHGAGIIYAGSSPVHKRKTLKNFKENWSNKVLIVAVRAANINLDLSMADRVVFVESSWNLQDNIQALMRVHNINQKKNVYVEWLHIGNEDKIIQGIYQNRCSTAFSQKLTDPAG